METTGIMMLILRLLGSLALLMYGMKTMSDALQKLAGPQLRHVLGAMTTNRFTGMLTGILVTAAVQSSTATTHHGCQYRNYPHCVDYVSWLFIQHHRFRLACLCYSHYPYL